MPEPAPVMTATLSEKVFTQITPFLTLFCRRKMILQQATSFVLSNYSATASLLTDTSELAGFFPSFILRFHTIIRVYK
jgi:hypothetical protein